MSMENRAIVRRLYEEVWNKRKVELVDELISTCHTLHNTYFPYFPGPGMGPEKYKRTVAGFMTAFPDLHLAVEDMISGENKVVASWILSGTHKGEFRGLDPTDRKVSVDGITIHHLAEGIGGGICGERFRLSRCGGQAGGLEHSGLVGGADRYDRMGSGSGRKRREAG